MVGYRRIRCFSGLLAWSPKTKIHSTSSLLVLCSLKGQRCEMASCSGTMGVFLCQSSALNRFTSTWKYCKSSLNNYVFELAGLLTAGPTNCHKIASLVAKRTIRSHSLCKRRICTLTFLSHQSVMKHFCRAE